MARLDIVVAAALVFAMSVHADPGPEQIAYTARPAGDLNYEVHVVEASGADERNLTNHPAWDWQPAWSPDGNSLAFTSHREEPEPGIYLMDVGTRDVRFLAAGEQATWSPDGSHIAYVEFRDGRTEVFAINIDGTGRRQVVKDGPRLQWYPAWSPGGEKIAFHSPLGERRIHVVAAEGGAPAPLVQGHAARSLDWSPGSDALLFTGVSKGDPEIFVVDADGRNIRQLTDQLGHDADARWSPDGAAIVFASRRFPPGIYAMDADGGDVRMLVEGPYIQPTWSGRRELSVTAPQKRPLSWGWVKETGGGMGNPR